MTTDGKKSILEIKLIPSLCAFRECRREQSYGGSSLRARSLNQKRKSSLEEDIAELKSCGLSRVEPAFVGHGLQDMVMFASGLEPMYCHTFLNPAGLCCCICLESSGDKP